MSGIHIAIPWPRGHPYKGGALRGPLRGPRPAAAGLLGAARPGCGAAAPPPESCCGRARARGEGALGRSPGLAFPRPPSRPRRPLLRCGTSVVCAPVAGALSAVPRALSRGPGFGPSSQAAPARPGPPPGPLRARRPAAAAPRRGLRAALAPAALRPGRALRGVRLAVLGPPCGALRAAPARPWPSPGGPCARLRRRRVPLASALRAGAAPRPGSSRPGALPGCARLYAPPPGVGVPPPAGGGVAFQFLGI